MEQGKFITLEGGEGTGKSTQQSLLVDAIKNRGIDVIATREPGGAPAAEEIRALLVRGAPGRWDALTEALLHFAARREHLLQVVWPSLQQGTWVVSDRFADSTMAYQGFGHQIGAPAVRTLFELVVGDFSPDLTLILDLPVEIGLRRATARRGEEDRYERMDLDFHQRLRRGFRSIARDEPERCMIIDATGSIDETHAAIMVAVESRLELTE